MNIMYACPFQTMASSYESKQQQLPSASNGTEEDQEEEFDCALCAYKTFRKSNLTQHVRTVHDRVKGFGCERCDYRSARRSNVAHHVKTVHENIKDFACRHCNFRCVYVTRLLRSSVTVWLLANLYGRLPASIVCAAPKTVASDVLVRFKESLVDLIVYALYNPLSPSRGGIFLLKFTQAYSANAKVP